MMIYKLSAGSDVLLFGTKMAHNGCNKELHGLGREVWLSMIKLYNKAHGGLIVHMRQVVAYH